MLKNILVYQFLVFIVYLIYKDEKKAFYVAASIPVLICTVAMTIFDAILLRYYRKYYNYYQFFADDGQWLTNRYMTVQMAKQFRQVSKNAEPVEYCVRLLQEGKELKTLPYFGNILTDKQIKSGKMGAINLKKFMVSK